MKLHPYKFSPNETVNDHGTLIIYKESVMPKTKEKESRKSLSQRILAKKDKSQRPARIPDARPKIEKNVGLKKQQVDGKNYSSPKARPRTLSELWGFRGDKFGTNDEGEYREKLSKANKADLQMMCIKIGLMPHDSRSIMVERLLKQFKQHIASARTLRTKPKAAPKGSSRLRKTLSNLGGNTLV